MTDIDILSDLYESHFGVKPDFVTRLPGAASTRKYFRLGSATADCIGVAGDNERDCRAFVNLSRAFRSEGVNVPEVYAATDDMRHYIQQDLGDVSLYDLLKRCDDPQSTLRPLIEKTLSQLVTMQYSDRLKWEGCLEYKRFGMRQAMWDLNYFKYEYVLPLNFNVDEDVLEDDFERFAKYLCDSARIVDDGFLYRDFQSRNVMICNDEPWFIDFQGGRLGPSIYDAVSFLWQAKAGFSDKFRMEMIDFYFDKVSHRLGKERNKDKELELARSFALFRTMQVLGAYGRRGLVERKAYFIESIPPALTNLKSLIAMGVADNYPELKRICEVICADTRYDGVVHDGLLVTVYSFSYKKGYPDDFTGNGGGFMFDCRGMHNPGRYEEYKPLTGRDASVIEFLESRGEVQRFVENAVDIVSPSIETYLRRGFSNLQVGFGCTGGRHRSVYCAEHAAQLLKRKYPEAKVNLIHREQGINEML